MNCCICTNIQIFIDFLLCVYVQYIVVVIINSSHRHHKHNSKPELICFFWHSAVERVSVCVRKRVYVGASFNPLEQDDNDPI